MIASPPGARIEFAKLAATYGEVRRDAHCRAADRTWVELKADGYRDIAGRHPRFPNVPLDGARPRAAASPLPPPTAERFIVRMADLANEFVQFLKALKANDGAAVAKHGTNVMALYAKGAPADDADKAVATIINSADGDGAFEFLAHLI